MVIEVMVALIFTIVAAIMLVGGFVFYVIVTRLQNKVDRLDKTVARIICYLADLRKMEILPPLHEYNEDDKSECLKKREV